MPEHSLSPARPRRSRALSLLVMSPVLLAGLVGCASLVPTPENIVEGVVEQVAEQSGEDLDVDVDATGDGVTLPADWPGLPVPEGRLFSAIKMGDSFSLSVEVDSEDAARATADELAASGFEVLSETDYGELKGLVLKSAEWSVVYGWTVSDEGITVSYTITPVTS
ncbi:hypothetical protein [Microbacterium aurantiacum]|uniref:Uncharacterized protein n=1 Tax=Microbacterium aurantiacum TaxID=162393 RepID=A0AAJ2HGK8_9MICO|nr:hypothetical protein [Microbacterium aurantiacum]MDS0244349.1 hypothetical protein [Microbacterium aurantiacum]